MRILLLSMYFAPDPAANAVVMTELAEQLVANGHDVTVVTAFPHYDKNKIWDQYHGKLVESDYHGSIRVYRTYLYVPADKTRIVGRLLNYVSFNVLSTLVSLYARGQDIILAPSPPLTIGLSAYLVSRIKRIPYVYNVQDIYPDIAIQLGVLTNKRLINLFERMERFIYRKATAVTILSDGARQNLLAKSVPDKKLHIIPNFIDVEFMRPLPKDNNFTHTHKLDDKCVVMYAGNVGLSQGLEHVLQAASELRAIPDIHFMIVGNGAAKADLMETASQEGLTNVTFLPFQPRAEIPTMYAAADILLVSLIGAIGHESVPSKAYTIMASGRPMIAAVGENAATHLMINDAECGVWVPSENPHALADAIRDLYKNPTRRLQLGNNGRHYVETNNTPQAIGKRYSTMLNSLVVN